MILKKTNKAMKDKASLTTKMTRILISSARLLAFSTSLSSTVARYASRKKYPPTMTRISRRMRRANKSFGDVMVLQNFFMSLIIRFY